MKGVTPDSDAIARFIARWSEMGDFGWEDTIRCRGCKRDFKTFADARAHVRKAHPEAMTKTER